MGIKIPSSELQEVLGISDRILVMLDGALVAALEADKATGEAVIQAAAGVGIRGGLNPDIEDTIGTLRCSWLTIKHHSVRTDSVLGQQGHETLR
jgi:hypothetical protein